jgi:phenylalanyl-tRNA synthetase alpha chain
MSEVFQQAEKLLEEIGSYPVENEQELEVFRIRFLGTKNILKDLFSEMGKLPVEEKKAFGQVMNQLKTTAEERFQSLKEGFENNEESGNKEEVDYTTPGIPLWEGSRHPISLTMNRIIQIFSKIGFTIADDREIEDEWHNFTALNTPEDHPSRDMTDTYYLLHDPAAILRSQTSTVQVRVMESQKPPIRIISPGRVYRNETISARAHCQFHQVEGLYIDKGVSMADLKQTLLYFAEEMFGKGTKIRMRPSFFPFTEPSAEVDVTCFICGGTGCPVCKQSGWVEILGCGMVDPQVLENCGIDSKVYSGFAFGMGVERQAMLRYKINDIRLLFENDFRFLKQFTTVHS